MVSAFILLLYPSITCKNFHGDVACHRVALYLVAVQPYQNAPDRAVESLFCIGGMLCWVNNLVPNPPGDGRTRRADPNPLGEVGKCWDLFMVLSGKGIDAMEPLRDLSWMENPERDMDLLSPSAALGDNYICSLVFPKNLWASCFLRFGIFHGEPASSDRFF